jgi:hypothetical protein
MLIDLAAEPLDEFSRYCHDLGIYDAADWNEADAYRWSSSAGLEGHEPGEAARAWVERWYLPGRAARSPGPGQTSYDDPEHHAAGPWGERMAVHTLYYWRFFPLPAANKIRLVDDRIAIALSPDRRLGLRQEIVLPPVSWDPQDETRADARTRILAEIAEAVDEGLAQIEAGTGHQGSPPTVKRTGLEHLVWLARYQFRGESYRAIAKAVWRSPQGVTEAVKDAATLVGLPLRDRNPGGRPRKQRSPDPN